MQPSLRKALTNNYVHKICSLFIGISVWGIVSSIHTDSLTLEIPLCFYTTQPTELAVPQAPGKISVTLRGKRSSLRQIDKSTLAAHVNVAEIGSSGMIPRITNKNLLLPKTVKVVEYKGI